jgi:HlyD family secretion protein
MNATTDTAEMRPAVNGELVHRVQQLRLDSQLGSAKAGRGGAGWLPWVLCALLAGTWATVAIRTYRNPGNAGPADSASATAPVSSGGGSARPTASSTLVAPRIESGSIQLEVKGYLIPAHQIAVSPIDVGGRVIELNVLEGKLFKEGDILARLQDTSYRQAVEEAAAGVAMAHRKLESAQARLAEQKPESVRKVEVQELQASLREAQALTERAENDLRRYRNIPGTVAAKELVQAEADYQSNAAKVERIKASLEMLVQGPRKERIAASEADVKAARAEVQVAEARQAQAQWKLDNCVIRAPITGTILSKKAELGNLVNPLAFNAGSGGVCDIADLADLEADLEIPERDIAKLKVGQPCRIKADAYPDRVYQGHLDRIMPIANRAKSIVNVRVKVHLPEGEVPGTYLKPEMGAVVSFLPLRSGQ